MGLTLMLFGTETPPPCSDPYNRELFYSPDEDGRTEIGRVEREALAGVLCRTECPRRLQCLERALVRKEAYGVWGGMGEGDRRNFIDHLQDEGYKKAEIPTGRELRSCEVTFYYLYPTPEEKFHGFDEVEMAEAASLAVAS